MYLIHSIYCSFCSFVWSGIILIERKLTFSHLFKEISILLKFCCKLLNFFIFFKKNEVLIFHFLKILIPRPIKILYEINFLIKIILSLAFLNNFFWKFKLSFRFSWYNFFYVVFIKFMVFNKCLFIFYLNSRAYHHFLLKYIFKNYKVPVILISLCFLHVVFLTKANFLCSINLFKFLSMAWW